MEPIARRGPDRRGDLKTSTYIVVFTSFMLIYSIPSTALPSLSGVEVLAGRKEIPSSSSTAVGIVVASLSLQR